MKEERDEDWFGIRSRAASSEPSCTSQGSHGISVCCPHRFLGCGMSLPPWKDGGADSEHLPVRCAPSTTHFITAPKRFLWVVSGFFFLSSTKHRERKTIVCQRGGHSPAVPRGFALSLIILYLLLFGRQVGLGSTAREEVPSRLLLAEKDFFGQI